MIWLMILGFLALIIFFNYKASHSPEAVAAQASKGERERNLVCPHCQTAGGVTTTMTKKKQGISGGKATGAILTAGVSLLGTGLARKGWVTQLRCSNCGMSWEVTA